MEAWWCLLIIAHLVYGNPEIFEDLYENSNCKKKGENVVEDRFQANPIYIPKAIFTKRKVSSDEEEREKKQPKFHSWGGKRYGEKAENEENTDPEEKGDFYDSTHKTLLTYIPLSHPLILSHLNADMIDSLIRTFSKHTYPKWEEKRDQVVNDRNKRPNLYGSISQQDTLGLGTAEQNRKRYPAFNSWAGKRAAAFNSWGGKRLVDPNGLEGKRTPAFNSWGGKRAGASNNWAGKRKDNKNIFNPNLYEVTNLSFLKNINSKNNENEMDDSLSCDNFDFNEFFSNKKNINKYFSWEENTEPDTEILDIKSAPVSNIWGGKRGPTFNSWGDKKSAAFNSWGGKRAAAFNSWGGKRAAAFNSWGGKRASAFNSWGGKRAAAFNSWGGKRIPDFNGWGGKRTAVFKRWEGKRTESFNSWGGKRNAAFNSWGGKKSAAFNSWGGKKSAALNWNRKRVPLFNSVDDKKAAACNSWGNKRAAVVNSWEENRFLTAFNSLNGKISPEFLSWEDKNDDANLPTTSNLNNNTKMNTNHFIFPIESNTYHLENDEQSGKLPNNIYRETAENELYKMNKNIDESKELQEELSYDEDAGRLDSITNKDKKLQDFYDVIRLNNKRGTDFFKLQPHYSGFSSWAGKRNSNYETVNKKASPAFSSWAGKRSPLFSAWYGSKVPTVQLSSGKRRPAFSSWGGKRSEIGWEKELSDCSSSNQIQEGKNCEVADEIYSEEINNNEQSPVKKNLMRNKREIDCNTEGNYALNIYGSGSCIDKKSDGNVKKNNLITEMMLQGGLKWPMTLKSHPRGVDFYAWGGKRSL